MSIARGPPCLKKCYNTLMLMVAFLQWWYGPGWRDASDRLLARLHNTYLTFSLPILLKTLFSPWRRIITPAGASLQARFRAVVDNAVSRAVGFTMRLSLLVTALIILSVTSLLGGLILVLWPIIPALGPILIVVGLV
jgi:hypothetical protein